ncbi:MAG TPA: YkgJ family cysteine cluster protein [Polyangiaceae bacterium LLY-WYZ-15_(1-7)]|nr:zinc/iron-chelating domain-containing protein [Myxococcales bacterium]HJK93081.1 YkgJ family cysteine cluster protein [Polyangiaceae bacterium LLY-WYZ-15_(1-7)]HJL05328.1 YkgJ family cysteine cluster protein [Polyangiaceae bacterium LLY-WYZ-15_(1-7)]HJL07946.1 YkgJ family cysteine cluster protein [Polyangiaceae bacterium LLY-WYZ-15_(1-7)]HJL23832.1 YkgJ family cysteine cluster protein [Polyangiaceae bacterium LLY-WYZ-15_(1-7)]
MDPREAHAALAARVDAFEAAARERGAEMRCGAGCDACCRVALSVCSLEAAPIREALDALPAARRRELAARAEDPAVRAGERCVMLEADGRCAVYAARPLVCRSQGLPLAYPPGVVPEQAVRAHLEGPAGEQELTWCPLNFVESPPAGEDVLDAGRLDEALATLQRAHVGPTGDPLARVSLRELAASTAPGA